MALPARLASAAALALLLLSGCEAGVTRDGGEQLTVENGSAIAFCTLHIKRANSQTQWGGNVLGRGEQLAPDGVLVIDRLRPGYYDLRALPCDEADGPGSYRYDLQLDAGQPAAWRIEE